MAGAGWAGAAGQPASAPPARPAPGASMTRRLCLFIAALACLLALAPACASSGALAASDTTTLDHLLALIVARLEVAPDVARAKWNTHAAIEDPPREQQVIAAVGASASGYGVPRDEAERFFRAQIEASKIVQQAMTQAFTAADQPPFPAPVNLETQIRPVLDRLTPELLRALGAARPLLARADARRTLERRSRRVAPTVAGGAAAMAAAVAPLTGGHSRSGHV